MSTKESRLYLTPDVFKLESVESVSEFARIHYPLILEHQLAGLKQMGCSIEELDTYTRTSHDNYPDNLYVNRIMNIRGRDISDIDLICRNVRNASLEINPFSQPSDIESKLGANGFVLKLGSDVLGKQVTGFNHLPDMPYKIERVVDERSREMAFSIFSSFFVKPGESLPDARKRFDENCAKGPHLVITDGESVVGSIGSITINKVASVYEGIVNQEYRSGLSIGLRMAMEIENVLLEDGVSFLYYKSRNRGVILSAKAFLGLKHLYNERVYEKKD